MADALSQLAFVAHASGELIPPVAREAASTTAPSASPAAPAVRVISSPADRSEYLKAKRRVPSSLRKRAQASCDACKIRRCKCQRQSGEESCKLCVDMGVPCVTTLPRKQRFYGSVESLDKKYRALEALVLGTFSSVHTNTTAEELVALGRSMGIKMPDFDTEETASSTTDTSISQSQKLRGSSLSCSEGSSQITTPSVTDSISTYLSNTHHERQYSRTSVQNSEAAEGDLLRDTSGRPHYIGPSGSLSFFAKLRELVAQHQRASPSSGASPGQCQDDAANADEFVQDRLAGALGGGDRHPGSPHDNIRRPSNCDSPPRLSAADQSSLAASRIVPPAEPTKIQLPPKEQADACVDAFFRVVHPSFILFHRATFQRTYEGLWHRPSSRVAQQSNQKPISTGWRCCLYMIFVFGSRSLPQTPSSLDFQRRYFSLANQVSDLLTPSTLSNICALLLLSLYAHNTNSRTSAWTLVGTASRLAIAIGMHRASASGSFEPLQRELRKRVWWTLYSFEQFLCCSLGRPSAIASEEVDIGVPSEELLDGNLTPPLYLEHASKLYMLLETIRRDIYHPAGHDSRISFRATQLLGSLKSWESALPRHLRPQPLETAVDATVIQWRSVMMLHVRYQHTLTFLTRPFLLQKAQAANDGSVIGGDTMATAELCNVCVQAAMCCGELLVELWRANCFNGVSWLDAFYAYSCSMILTLKLLAQSSEQNVQNNAERRYTEQVQDMVRKLLQVMQSVQMCGTMARFAKVSEEFAKVIGITASNSSSSRKPFKSSPPNKSRLHSMTSASTLSIGASPTQHMMSQAISLNAGTGHDVTTTYMQPTFSGIYGLDPNHTPSHAESEMQWDMVMQPAEWNEAGHFAAQLDWGWQDPTDTTTDL